MHPPKSAGFFDMTEKNIRSLKEHQLRYNLWKHDAGFGNETIDDVMLGHRHNGKGGLSGEVEELNKEIIKKNPFGIAGELADVYEFCAVLADIFGYPIDKLPLINGQPATSFKELQAEGKRQLSLNGHHTPIDHVNDILVDIEKLKEIYRSEGSEKIELIARMILHTAVIMEQLGIPMEKAIAAKDRRNSKKYAKQNIQLTAELFQVPVISDESVSAISIVRSEWDGTQDDKFLRRELGVLATARLALANPIGSFKKGVSNLKSLSKKSPQSL